LIKVPEEPSPALVSESVDPPAARPTFVGRRVGKKSNKAPVRGGLGGLVAAPKDLEESWTESLTYPLWGDAGLAMLAFLPVGLWFATVPLFGLLPTLIVGSVMSLFAGIFTFPLLIVLAIIGGQLFGFLGQVFVTSSLGELHQPRSPGWGLSEMGSTLGRWFWAGLIGLVIGGAPTVIYWINCGEVDWLDRIVILDLIIPGLAYAQMALLATLIHESPLAANPVTVLAAIWRVGWAYVAPCVRTGAVLLGIGLLFEGVFWIKDPFGQAVAFWVFWVVVLYLAMVVFRWLGLFCHRQAEALGWFAGPTGQVE
jgi:hypothetical protein